MRAARGPTSIPFVGLAKPALRILNGFLTLSLHLLTGA